MTTQRPDFSDPQCSAVLVKLMDATARRKWRLLSRACCQDVYHNTKTLTWLLGGDNDPEQGNHPDHAEALAEAEAMAKQDVEHAVAAAGSTAAATAAASLAAAAVQDAELQVSWLHGVTISTAICVQLYMDREVVKAAARHAKSMAGAYAAQGVQVKVNVLARSHRLPERLLGKLPCLRTLRCRGMQLSSLDGIPPQLRLHCLDISYTGTILSHAAGRLAALRAGGLRCLVARGLHIEEEDVQAVCGLAGSLQELDLSELDDDLSQPLPALEQLLGLRSFGAEMSDGPMLGYGDTLMSLLPHLQLMTQLSSLRLGGLLAMVQEEEAKGVHAALGEALRRLPQLQELSLWVSAEYYDEEATEQRLGGAVYGAVAPALAAAAPPLRSLLLGNSMMGPDGVGALAAALPALGATLQVLRLEGALMGPDGAAALAAPLGGLTALRELDLASNRLTAGSTLTLAPPLAQLRQLRVLCLAGNSIGGAGAAMLAAHITGLTCLAELLLGHNELTLVGVEALYPALACLPALRLLDVGHNMLLDEAASWSELWAAAPGLTQLRAGSEWAGCIGYGARAQLNYGDAAAGGGGGIGGPGLAGAWYDPEGMDLDDSGDSGSGSSSSSDSSSGASDSDDDDEDDDGSSGSSIDSNSSDGGVDDPIGDAGYAALLGAEIGAGLGAGGSSSDDDDDDDDDDEDEDYSM